MHLPSFLRSLINSYLPSWQTIKLWMFSFVETFYQADGYNKVLCFIPRWGWLGCIWVCKWPRDSIPAAPPRAGPAGRGGLPSSCRQWLSITPHHGISSEVNFQVRFLLTPATASVKEDERRFKFPPKSHFYPTVWTGSEPAVSKRGALLPVDLPRLGYLESEVDSLASSRVIMQAQRSLIM